MRRVSAPIALANPLHYSRTHTNTSSDSIRKYEKQLSSIDSYTTRVKHEFDAFDDKRIRFLMFVENHEGSRYVLFDSKARATRRPFPTSASSSSISPTVSSPHASTTPKYLNQSEKAKLDTNMLIKMVFGSMPMVVTNRNSMKVHSFKSENKIMLSNVFNYVHNSANSLMVSPLDIDLSSSTHSTSTTATCTNASSQHAGTGFHRRTSNVNIGESASVSVSGSTRHSSKQSSIDKDNDHFINTATHQPIHNTSNIRYGSASSNPVPIIKNDITKLNHFNSSLNQKVTVKASSVTKSFASSSLCSNSPTSSLPLANNQQCSSSYSCGIYKRYKRSVSSSLRSNSNHELENSKTQSDIIFSSSSNDNLLTTSPPPASTPAPTLSNSKYMTKYKIGISLIFAPHLDLAIDVNEALNEVSHNEAFFNFFFAHLPLIEYQLREMRSHVIPALPVIFGASRNGAHLSKLSKFSHPEFLKIDRELDDFRCKFNMLYNSPRLKEPAWLTVTNSSRSESPHASSQPSDTRRSSLLSNLINDLVYLDKKLNGPKQSRMFLNRLISTVLKHNLSWLNTVVPSLENDSQSESSSLSSSSCTSPTTNASNHRLRKKRVNWTQHLERTNPYNPLWAQLGDLHGAIGDPLSLTRTVIIGENRELVTRILFVLSYFIRCSGNTYYDIKPIEVDLDHLIASRGHQKVKPVPNGLLTSVEAHINGDQREISVFELGTSPTVDIHLSPLRQLHVNHESSPQISLYNLNRNIEMLNIQVKNGTTTATTTDTSSSSLVFSPTVHNGHYSSSPDIITMSDDARLKSPGEKPPRFSQNSVKHRQISSNSLGEHCNSMSLPLIGLV